MTQNTVPQVQTRQFTIKEMADRADGKDRNKPEVVYEFSNGRKFESTDATESGIYKHD